jgi:ABC-type glycerol-3-phosphate transport system substrate-binding protein
MKRIVVLIAVALLAASAAAWAAGGTESAPAKQEIIKIKVFGRNAHHANVPFVADDKVVEYVGSKFGLQIEVATTPAGEFTKKLAMMISAGDIPDVMTTFAKGGAADQELYQMMLKAKKLVNLSDMAKQGAYPKLSALFADPYAKLYSAEADGSFYELPSFYGLWPHAFYIRADWLAELGLKKPQTLDEVYAALKQFVAKDPDGKQTLGLTFDGTFWLGHIYAGYTHAKDWAVRNGKFVSVWTLPEQKEAVKAVARLNREGLLDKDIFTGQKGNDIAKFSSGKAGVLIVDFVYLNQIEKALADIKPTAKVDLLAPDLRGPYAVARMAGNAPYFSAHAVWSGTKDARRIMDLFEYLLSDEGRDVTIRGVEGVHYTMQGGKRVPNETVLKHENWGLPGLRSRHRISSLVTLEQYYDPATFRTPSLVDYFFSKMNDTGFLKQLGVSAVEGLNVADVQKEIGSKPEDLRAKWEIAFILGQKDVDKDWDQFLAEYRAAGLDKLEAAYNQLYKPAQ